MNILAFSKPDAELAPTGSIRFGSAWFQLIVRIYVFNPVCVLLSTSEHRSQISRRLHKYTSASFSMNTTRFTCTLCPKTFAQKRNLSRHLVTHEKAKYPCGKCGKGFRRKDLLTKHQTKCLVILDDDKRCNICNTTFTQKCHVKRHRKVCELNRKPSK